MKKSNGTTRVPSLFLCLQVNLTTTRQIGICSFLPCKGRCHEVTERFENSYRQIQVYRVDYITLNLNLQSGAGVPPTLIHYYFLLITLPKIDPKD